MRTSKPEDNLSAPHRDMSLYERVILNLQNVRVCCGKFDTCEISNCVPRLHYCLESSKKRSQDLENALIACLPFIDDADDIATVFPESAASSECRAAVIAAKKTLARKQP